MQTIQPIQLENASVTTKRLLATASGKTGLPSNMIKTVAQSPIVLEGYLQFSRALEGGWSPKRISTFPRSGSN